jgi:hypothetical protein
VKTQKKNESITGDAFLPGGKENLCAGERVWNANQHSFASALMQNSLRVDGSCLKD